MIPSTIADLVITGLILGYGHKIGSKVENVQDMTKSILDNLPSLVETSQELRLRLQERLTALKYRPKLYETLPIDLSKARNKEKFDVTGTHLLAQSINGELEVRFSEQDADPVTINGDNRVFEVGFDCLYVTNTAQSGKSVTFLIGKAGAFVGGAITPMTFNAQDIGVYLEPEWAAKEGKAKQLRAVGLDKAFSFGADIDYDVPTGKTLYINGFTGCSHASSPTDAGSPHMCWGTLVVAGSTLVDVGGNGGFAITFPTPIVATQGQHVDGNIRNWENHDCDVSGTIIGYEI